MRRNQGQRTRLCKIDNSLPEEKISDGEQRAQQPICLIVTVAHWGPRILWVYCLCCRKSSHSVLAAESCRIPSVEVRSDSLSLVNLHQAFLYVWLCAHTAHAESWQTSQAWMVMAFPNAVIARHICQSLRQRKSWLNSGSGGGQPLVYSYSSAARC